MDSQKFRQEHKQVQSQVISPQLRESLKILQVSALELRNAILEELQLNPVLEEEPMRGISIEEESDDKKVPEKNSDDEVAFNDDNFEVLKKIDEEFEDYFNDQRSTAPQYSEVAKRRQHFLDSVVSEKSLLEHLLEQAHLSDCSKEELKAIEVLVGNLDDKGFLSIQLSELSKSSKIPEALLSKAQKMLIGFDPVGIGSSTIQDCLLAQLKANDQQASLAASILKNHYELLLRRKIPELAKILKVENEDIQAAFDEISVLNPAPGRRFMEDSNRIVTPDLAILKDGQKWRVYLNNEYIPRLRIGSAYKELIAKGGLAKKELTYLREKMTAGKFIISAIEQRQKTIESIAYSLIDLQREFFEHGSSKLIPLTMRKVAEDLGMHETTIGRAVANKFVQTPHGVFPFKFFFTSGYESSQGEEAVSSTSIKEALSKILASEPSNKPYRDQDIVNILEEKGIKIARRTVAKYREELGILSKRLRKKY